MRLSKTDSVSGIPAPIARALMRRIGGRSWYRTGVEETLADYGVADPARAAQALISDGLLEPKAEFNGEPIFEATVRGNAVAMASFGRLITRATADRLVAGLLERAKDYNSDGTKPLFVKRLRLFGSYLDPETDRLGDVDVEVQLVDRNGLSDDDRLRYGRRSGRAFHTFLDELAWPHTEALQILKNRSAALNITVEDIDRLTDRSRIVFEADQ